MLIRNLKRRTAQRGFRIINCSRLWPSAYRDSCRVRLARSNRIGDSADLSHSEPRSFHLRCRYRSGVEFSIEEIEALLSSRFIDEDFFKPTMRKYSSGQGVRFPLRLMLSD